MPSHTISITGELGTMSTDGAFVPFSLGNESTHQVGDASVTFKYSKRSMYQWSDYLAAKSASWVFKISNSFYYELELEAVQVRESGRKEF